MDHSVSGKLATFLTQRVLRKMFYKNFQSSQHFDKVLTLFVRGWGIGAWKIKEYHKFVPSLTFTIIQMVIKENIN